MNLIFMTQLINYPIDAVNINQGDITLYSAVAFVSAYSPRTAGEVKVTSIDDCFTIFDSRIYSMCIALTLLIYSVVYIRSQLLQRLSKPSEEEDDQSGCSLYELVTHLTGFGSISDSGLFMRTIFIVSCLYSFLILAIYFCGFISTELMAVDPPVIFRNYQDLLDARVPLVYIKGFNTYKKFKFATNNTQEAKLWQMGIEKYGENDLFFSVEELNSLIRNTGHFLNIQSAIAFESSFTSLFLNDFCTISNDKVVKNKFEYIIGRKIGNLLPFVSIDPSEKWILKGIIYSEHFQGPLFKLLRHRFITLRENGLVEKVLEMAQQTGGWTSNFRNRDEKDSNAYGRIRQCKDGIIEVPEGDLQSVSVQNVRSFIFLCGYVVSLPFFILLLETLIPRRGLRVKRHH